MIINGEVRYTTAEAAAELGREPNTVRVYVSRHNLGSWVGDLRVLSAADLDTIRRARPGKPRSANYKPRTRRAAPSPATATAPAEIAP